MSKVKISTEEVKKVARLANLKLTPPEFKKLQKQLGETLDYVAIINEIKTISVKPTSQVTGLSNVTRDDQTEGCFEQKEALSGAKSTHNGYFKVKAIFD